MMKYYMISLKEQYFNMILNGTKTFEFRRVFAVSVNQPFLCAIYVTSPVQEVKGVIYFDKPIKDSIDSLLKLAKKSNYPFIQSVRDYFNEKSTGYALPVLKIRLFKKPIMLSDIKEIFPKFRPPQSFYCLEKEYFLRIRDYIDKYESQNDYMKSS